MASTERKSAQNEQQDYEWPTEWPIVPILVVDHSKQPSRRRPMMDPSDSLFAPEWPTFTDTVLERGSFGIENRPPPLTSSTITPTSPNKLTKTPTRSATPSSPLKEDWTSTTIDIRTPDTAFEKGTLSPQWTDASTGPIVPQWVTTQPPASSSISDLKSPKHTTYHIYHAKSHRHYTATTRRRPKKQMKCFACLRRAPRVSEKERAAAIEKGLLSSTSGNASLGAGATLQEDWGYGAGLPGEGEEEEGYFWHKPFGCGKRRGKRGKESATPRNQKGKKVRTFRRGVSKEQSTVLAEVPHHCLWKKWKVVWYDEDAAEELQRSESNWELPPGKTADEDALRKRLKKRKGKDDRSVTELVWHKAFSKKVRQYDFTLGNLDFCWKGTSTVTGTGFWKNWLRYNHLKLVARIPLADHPKDVAICDSGFREIVLAKYTSSSKYIKAGALEMYDDVINHVWREYVLPQERQEGKGTKEKEEGSFKYGRSPATVKETRFWDTLVATGMCMVVGEWQKRETVRQIIAALASGAAGA